MTKSTCCFLLFLLWNILTLEGTGNLGNKRVLIQRGIYKNFLDVSSVNSFTANLKGEATVFIGLFDDAGIVYQIGIAADNYDIRECLRTGTCTAPIRAANTTFNNDTFSAFWFQWEAGQVRFGTGIVAGVNRIGLNQVNRTVNVKYWAVTASRTAYIEYEYTAKFSCHKGCKLVNSVKRIKPATHIGLVDCSRECAKMKYCYAVNYRRQHQFNNCEYYVTPGKIKNKDVITPFNITANNDWVYCHMTRQ